MKNSPLYYSVGPLLYCPANRADIASSIQQEKFGAQYSLALCLEDTINDRFVAQAQEMLVCSIHQLHDAFRSRSFFMPKIFIRVRRPSQIKEILNRLGNSAQI